MDTNAQRLYTEALTAGSEKVYNIKLTMIGQKSVGKTSLIRQLLGEGARETGTESTEDINIQNMCCQIDPDTRDWIKKTDAIPSNGHRQDDVVISATTTKEREISKRPEAIEIMPSYDISKRPEAIEITPSYEVSKRPEAIEITPSYDISQIIVSNKYFGTLVEPDTDDVQNRMTNDAGILPNKTLGILFLEQNIQCSNLGREPPSRKQHSEPSSSNATQDIMSTDANISPSKTQLPSLRGEILPSFIELQSSSIANDEENHYYNIDKRIQNADSDIKCSHFDFKKQNECQHVNSFQGEITKHDQIERTLATSMKATCNITLMDSIGHTMSYITQHASLSRRKLYIILTNLSLSLSDAVNEDNLKMTDERDEISTIQDTLVYWLNSIFSRVFVSSDCKSHMEINENKQMQGSESDQDNTRFCPSIILVGTHVDKIPQESLNNHKESYFQEIRNMVKDKPIRHYLVDKDFTINNLGSDSTINELKSKIFEMVQKQEYWGEELPARWIRLEQELMMLRQKEEPVINYADVEKINDSLQPKIERPEELELFLRFEHDIGNIVFFNTEGFRHKVIIDPELLIRGLTTFIESNQLIKTHQEIPGKWSDFNRNGRLARTCIDFLWSHHPDLHEHREYLLNVMGRINIVAGPLLDEDNRDVYYWVPCIIHEKVPDHIKSLGESGDTTKTPALCFQSINNFIHIAVFFSLIALCLSKWPPGMEGKNYLLFSGLCVFELDDLHSLTLALNDSVIHATVIRYTKKRRVPDLSVCITVRNYLQTALSEIADRLCPSSEFEICIKCNKSSLLTNEGLHKLSSLRKHDEMRCNSHEGIHCVDSLELLSFWEDAESRIPNKVLSTTATKAVTSS
ncbi:hypothetical protein CHS0354_010728 [Potamilus streckersoni]|uniref:COR domain-containing protein n=1 Tax=Potamilus streckersoni TaxID=2493646 RepID=A0AAE0SUW3_9BIVA|nr:hypothetical protein CHS0354_010728 [Potamilus streckersoni]